MLLKLDMVQMAAMAVVVLMLGQAIKRKFKVLDKYCIPAPVIGGLIFALIALALKQTGVMEFEMDNTLQKVFMTAFFTTVGFTASFKLLKKGGKDVMLFLVLAVVLVIFQDVIGVTFAKLFNLNPLLGLSTGSVPMTGGHGTSGAFAPIFEEKGALGASTIAMASATFGLIVGSMIGGPVGKRLIEKFNLTPDQSLIIGGSTDESSVTTNVTAASLLSAVSAIFIAMGLGTILSALLQKTGMTFPSYIGAMFVAAIMRNINDSTNVINLKMFEIDMVGNVSLSLFLSMALMGLKLWQLADLALPLIVMLVAQATLMGLFAYFITFNVMGRDYDAAVMACGHCGFGMGATPNAMANMEVISSKYGSSYKAFFILPIVGSLFIDFCNAGVITFFVNMFA